MTPAMYEVIYNDGSRNIKVVCLARCEDEAKAVVLESDATAKALDMKAKRLASDDVIYLQAWRL